MQNRLEIFAPLSQSMLADPYSVYRTLQQDDPVHWHEQLRPWVLTRYQDCAQVIGDPKTFVNDYRVLGEDPPREILGLQTLDAPEHGAVRHLVLAALRQVDVPAWARGVKEEADRLG